MNKAWLLNPAHWGIIKAESKVITTKTKITKPLTKINQWAFLFVFSILLAPNSGPIKIFKFRLITGKMTKIIELITKPMAIALATAGSLKLVKREIFKITPKPEVINAAKMKILLNTFLIKILSNEKSFCKLIPIWSQLNLRKISNKKVLKTELIK